MTQIGFVLSHEQFSAPVLIELGVAAEQAGFDDEQVIKQWLVSADPEEHVHSIRQLFDAGITEVYIHSGQADQMRVVNFYGQEVLPRLRR